MANIKKTLLNISFFIIVVLTIILSINEYFYYKNELEMAREMHGDGYYVVELLMAMVPAVLVVEIAIETSMFFNLRYFIIHEHKTTIKTVFNVLMFIFAVALLSSNFMFDNIAVPLLSIFFYFLLGLRISYIFIAKRY